MPTSPMVTAIDLTRINVDAMTLDDLEEHALKVLDTLAELNAYLNSPGPKSAAERRNALMQSNKLRLHMHHVRGLIDAHKAASAWIAAAQQAAGSAAHSHNVLHTGP